MISIEYSQDPKKRTAQKVVLWTVVGLAGISAFGLLFGFLIQFLWNVTLVELFDFPVITFWQAVGLFVLAKFIFGFGGSSGSNAKKSKTEECKEEDLDEPAADVAELTADESFQKFWQKEGRQAYEEFQLRNDNSEGRDGDVT